jgi:hypothetical protein
MLNVFYCCMSQIFIMEVAFEIFFPDFLSGLIFFYLLFSAAKVQFFYFQT